MIYNNKYLPWTWPRPLLSRTPSSTPTWGRERGEEGEGEGGGGRRGRGEGEGEEGEERDRGSETAKVMHLEFKMECCHIKGLYI